MKVLIRVLICALLIWAFSIVPAYAAMKIDLPVGVTIRPVVAVAINSETETSMILVTDTNRRIRAKVGPRCGIRWETNEVYYLIGLAGMGTVVTPAIQFRDHVQRTANFLESLNAVSENGQVCVISGN